jgi:phospholipase/carboxylesterase
MLRSTMTLVAAGLLAAVTAPAAAAGPGLTARPAAVPLTLKAGVSQLTPKAYTYVPNGIAGPAPLIVLFHGAGQEAQPFLESFRGQADARGAILLALKSEGKTWTMTSAGSDVDFGVDPANLDAALRELFAKAPIDPKRIAALGFSDGASYALTLGVSNPKLFSGIVALSAGALWLPSKVDSGQRLYIAHGRDDDVLPIANVRDRLVPGLEQAGLRPRVRWFNGEHEMDRRAIQDGLDHALGEQR